MLCFIWLPYHVVYCKSQKITNKSQQLIDSIMHSVSIAQLNCILSLFDSGHSDHDISCIFGLHHTSISITCRKNYPDLQSVPAGHPPKLSEADTHCVQHVITLGKTENASQITHLLEEVTILSLTFQQTRNQLKKSGLEDVKGPKSLCSLRGIGGRSWILL